MTEPAAPGGAGALLRAAREKQGLHIAALAASLKVAPRKLEALERDDWSELSDAAFARALAMSCCRVLKIDPAPVLARLPAAAPASLEPIASGLNTPFRDRGGEPVAAVLVRAPLVWAGGLLVLAALVLVLAPAGWWRGALPSAAEPASGTVISVPLPAPVTLPAPEASAPVADGGMGGTGGTGATVPAPVAAPASAPPALPVVETVHSVPAELGASAPANGALVLRVSEPSWVEVVDGAGQVLVSRTLQPGESLGLDGPPPLKLKIGNAAATQLRYRGQPVDLAAATRDNVARLELP